MPMQQNTRQADININAIGDNIVVPLVTGRKIRVWKIWLKAVGAVGVIFKNGVAGVAFNARAIPLAVGEQWEKPQDETPLWQTGKGLDFVINTDAVGPITGRVDYTLL
jgi:hypothetical protein